MTGGEPAPGSRAPQALAVSARHAEIVAGLAALVTDETVEEHRREPAGHHSPALAQVLAYLRQAPTAGKLAAHAVDPGRQWQVVRLSGEPGVPHDLSDPDRFGSEDAVAHEVFLRRLAELGLRPRGAGSRDGR